MNPHADLPPRLRRALHEDSGAVAPLKPPSRRVLALVPLALLLLWWVPAHFGLRHDFVLLGPGRSIIASGFQLVGGLLIVAGALFEAVPGRQLNGRRFLLLGALGAAVFLVLTALAAAASPTLVPIGREARYLRVCLGTPPLLGAPLLALAMALAFRAYPVRPVVVGALAGFGSGLIADSAWRLFCEVADPVHVLTAHGGAILLLTLVGAVGSSLVSRWRRPS